jgi:hypothetical protein
MPHQTRMSIRFNAIVIAPEAGATNINVPRPNVPPVVLVRAELEREVAQEASEVRHKSGAFCLDRNSSVTSGS